MRVFILALLFLAAGYGMGWKTKPNPMAGCEVVRVLGDEHSSMTTFENYLVLKNPVSFECYDTPTPR